MNNFISNIFSSSLNIPSSHILNITFLGGMTNKNYLLETKENRYVIRVPGAMTSELISRHNEALNSMIMSDSGFNADTCYFNAESGVKITKYLPQHEALDHKTVRNKDNLRTIAEKLYSLHNSGIQLKNEFNVFSEFEKYISLLKNKDLFFKYKKEIPLILKLFNEIKVFLNKNISLSPCHNDLVPENILLNKESIYFIDWEYSGMNDPLFDIAAFLLEANLNPSQKELFLKYYFKNDNINETILKKIKLYQFSQDVIWFVWTLIKEENNEFFDGYGDTRIERALNFMKKYEYQDMI